MRFLIKLLSISILITESEAQIWRGGKGRPHQGEGIRDQNSNGDEWSDKKWEFDSNANGKGNGNNNGNGKNPAVDRPVRPVDRPFQPIYTTAPPVYRPVQPIYAAAPPVYRPVAPVVFNPYNNPNGYSNSNPYGGSNSNPYAGLKTNPFAYNPSLFGIGKFFRKGFGKR